eukprot:scaffold1291_cov80-Cylindrotheca_fusiformis.AAC.1
MSDIAVKFCAKDREIHHLETLLPEPTPLLNTSSSNICTDELRVTTVDGTHKNLCFLSPNNHLKRLDIPVSLICFRLVAMEHPNKDESSEVEDVQPEYFVYTRQTKEDDIPKQTLTHLRIDSSVTEIPDSAFEHCRALTHVLVASSVREISNRAFIFCRALTH